MKGIFCPAEKYFETIFSFRMVEMDFRSCGNCLLFFNLFFLQFETLTETNRNKYFGKDFVPVERDLPPSGNYFLVFRASFLQVETVTETR